MKIRLAKKIMKQHPDNNLTRHELSLYWFGQWYKSESLIFAALKSRGADHRITKAISLTSKKKKYGR